jgi:hypothetical protein
MESLTLVKMGEDSNPFYAIVFNDQVIEYCTTLEATCIRIEQYRMYLNSTAATQEAA